MWDRKNGKRPCRRIRERKPRLRDRLPLERDPGSLRDCADFRCGRWSGRGQRRKAGALFHYGNGKAGAGQRLYPAPLGPGMMRSGSWTTGGPTAEWRRAFTILVGDRADHGGPGGLA